MRFRLVALPVVALLALGACGGGGDEDAAEDTVAREPGQRVGSEADDAAREGDEPVATRGTGEITIAGTAFAFTSDSCAIGTGDTPTIQVTGKGNTGGRDYEVEIARSQPTTNYVERVRLSYSGVEASVATNIGGADAVVFEVDDRDVTASGLRFNGGGGAPSGDGSLTFACEDG